MKSLYSRNFPTWQERLSDFSHSLANPENRIIPVMPRNPLRDRVQERLGELDRSPIEAATRGGLERNFFRDLVKGDKESIGQKYLAKAAKGLDWSVAQLLGDTISALRVEIPPDPADVPEIDLRAGAAYAGGFAQEEVTVGEGGAVVGTDAVRQRWGIPLPFLRDELHVRPGRFHILAVRGDSMVDTLFDGDRVGIDLDDTDVSQGGVFALVDDNGSVIIKQVELLRTKGEVRQIRCKSRNSNYEPFDLPLDEPVKIIGRVACKITRL